MNEHIPTNENGAEKILNEREVLNLFDEMVGGEYEIIRSSEDAEGLLVLEVRTVGEDGEMVQYDYVRKNHDPQNFATETAISVQYFIGDMPVSGQTLKRLRGGVWVPEVD